MAAVAIVEPPLIPVTSMVPPVSYHGSLLAASGRRRSCW